MAEAQTPIDPTEVTSVDSNTQPTATPVTNSQLPEAVQQLKQIERAQVTGTPTATLSPGAAVQAEVTANPATPIEKIKHTAKLLIQKFKAAPIPVKALVIGVVAVFLLGLCMMTLTLTAVDTKIFSLSLAGKVIDAEGGVIPNAQIKLDNLTATSDAQGNFTIPNLEIKRYQLSITASGYEDYFQEIAISRSFLNYVNNRIFELKAAGEASITGKLVADTASYNFVDDKFVIADQIFPVRRDGSFELTNLETGKVKLEFQSVNFKDLSYDIELKGGRNDLGEVKLTPAGDIVGSLKSWLREDLVDKLNIEIEGVPAEMIVKSTDSFRVKDLEIARKYNVRTSAEGYLTRDYEIGIKQGENQLFGFNIVESGLIPIKRADADKKVNIFAVEYDGSNPKQISKDTRAPVAEFAAGNSVYYFSLGGNVGNVLGGQGYSTFAANMIDGTARSVLVNKENIGVQVPNFAGGKIANIRREQGGNNQQQARTLEVMDLEGTNRVVVQKITSGTFSDIMISDNGEVIYFVITENNAANGLYRARTTDPQPVKLNTKDNLDIFTVSADGNRVIYAAKNPNTGLADLFLNNQSAGQDTTLRPAFTGKHYQFVTKDNNFIIFTDTRNGAKNLFKLDLNSNAESALTNYTGGENVNAAFQQNGLILYQTNRGMYLMDFTKPVQGKLITTDFAEYTEYKIER